jgi:hypothetical protein
MKTQYMKNDHMDETTRKTVWKNKRFVMDKKKEEPFKTKSVLDDFLPQHNPYLDQSSATYPYIQSRTSYPSKKKHGKSWNADDEDELYIDMLDHDTMDYSNTYEQGGEDYGDYNTHEDAMVEPLVNMGDGEGNAQGNGGSGGSGGSRDNEDGADAKLSWNMPYYKLDDYVEDVSYNINEFNLFPRDLTQEKLDASKNEVLEKVVNDVTQPVEMLPGRRVDHTFNKMVTNFSYTTFREFVRALAYYIPETIDYYAYYISFKFASLYYKTEYNALNMYYTRGRAAEKLEKYAKYAENYKNDGKKTMEEIDEEYKKKREEEAKKIKEYLSKSSSLHLDSFLIKYNLYIFASIPIALYVAYNWWFLFQSDDSFIDFTKILEYVKPAHFFLESTIQPMNFLNYFLLGLKNEDHVKKILNNMEYVFSLKGILMIVLFFVVYYLIFLFCFNYFTLVNDIIDTKKNTLYSVAFGIVILYYLSKDVFNLSNLKDMISILRNPIFVCAGLLIKFMFVMIFVPLSLPFVFLFLIIYSLFGIIMHKGIGELWSTMQILNFEIENSVELSNDEECSGNSTIRLIFHYLNKYLFRYMLPIIMISVAIRGIFLNMNMISQPIQLMLFTFYGLIIFLSIIYAVFFK